MLTTNDVVIRFGGLTAVNKVSIHIAPNQITGLIGPNGAGKTTFFNAISGVYKPDEGTILFEGKHIEGHRPYQINEVGISRTYQVINLFTGMSVIENVIVGMHARLKSNYFKDLFHTAAQRREEKAVYEKARELLQFVGLYEYRDQPAASLSYGKQRLLEIARAMASDPKLLLLDEPAAGMNSAEKLEFDELLQKILDRGFTILMIEHDMKLVMGVCDYVYVLENGKLLSHGQPAFVQNDPAVIQAYLGV